MEGNKTTFNSIDEYISQYPAGVQEILNKLRKVIKESAPEAEGKIGYQMPTFALYGNLVHFAAYKNHIGFYEHLVELMHLRMNYQDIKGQKDQYNFL